VVIWEENNVTVQQKIYEIRKSHLIKKLICKANVNFREVDYIKCPGLQYNPDTGTAKSNRAACFLI
jgi:hypothetical protein